MGKHSDTDSHTESRDHKEKKEKKEKKDKKRRRDDKEEDSHENNKEESKKRSSSSNEKSESKNKENGHSSKKQKKEDHHSSKDDDDGKNDDRDADIEKREDSEEELIKKSQEEGADPDDEAGLDNFAISESVKQKLRAKGINKLFPIQYETFDHILNGKDIVGKARTGTGKTFAFVLPTVERLLKTKEKSTKKPRVLVLTPTRELAKQIHGDFTYVIGNLLKVSCVYGGTFIRDQIYEIRDGVNIIVGTPGRIKDLLNRNCLTFSEVDHIIIDEADEMLNRGFQEDVELILGQVPKENNPVTMLFSATIPPWVKNLMRQHLKPDYVLIDLIGKGDETKAAKTVEHISIFVPHWEIKDEILMDLIKTYSGGGRTILFTKTKADAVRLQNLPQMSNAAQSLHGDIKQEHREMALDAFKRGNYKILIATDVAARGLDIPQVELVLQLEPPTDYNTYIHRSGRTGRAGRSGRSLVMYVQKQKYLISMLEKECKIKFKKVGIPLPETMVQESLKDAVENMGEVEPAVIDLFKSAATEVLKKYSPEEALARALAGATGFNKLPAARSLFGRNGFTTLLFSTKRQNGYITKSTARSFLQDALQRNMPGTVYFASCANEANLVCDIPAACVAMLPPSEKAQIKWDPIKELPELAEDDQGGGGQGGRGGYSFGHGGGQGGGSGGPRFRGDWTCSQCNFNNFGSRTSCKHCGTNKSKSGPGGRWNNDSNSGGNYGSNENRSGGYGRDNRSGGGFDRRQSSGSASSGPF